MIRPKRKRGVEVEQMEEVVVDEEEAA